MQITPKTNSFFITIILTLLSFNVYADAITSKPLVFNLNDGSNITILTNRNITKVKNTIPKNCIVAKTHGSLTSHLMKADEAFFIFKIKSNRNLFVVLLREPSNPKHRTGYCGAGFEDFLLLIEITSKEAYLRDQFLLQSCIESRLLYSEMNEDSLEDPLKSIEIDKNNLLIKFEWLEEIQGNSRTIRVEDGHFVMHSTKASQ